MHISFFIPLVLSGDGFLLSGPSRFSCFFKIWDLILGTNFFFFNLPNSWTRSFERFFFFFLWNSTRPDRTWACVSDLCNSCVYSIAIPLLSLRSAIHIPAQNWSVWIVLNYSIQLRCVQICTSFCESRQLLFLNIWIPDCCYLQHTTIWW